MIIFAYILFAMLIIRFLVLLVNYISKPYLGQRNVREHPLISILIPARNEESNIGNLLSDLKKTDYEHLEIIVCNDHSTDRTEEIIRDYQKEMPCLSYFNNKPLPAGWIGKNYACHRLSEKAKGDYLLFLDADVRIKNGFIEKVAAYMNDSGKKLLSMFPQQIILSKGEKKTVPLMTWILLTFLPLPLIRWKWFASLSAANGQMMCFEAKSYKEHRWHEKFQSFNVEDIVIARNMKRKKLPVALMLGKEDVLCRMYQTYDEAIKGFALNIHQYFNGSRLWMIFYLLMVLLRLPYFLLIGQFELFVVSILIITIMRLMHARLSGTSAKASLYYFIPQILALLKVVGQNLRNLSSKKIEWKGRVYSS